MRVLKFGGSVLREPVDFEHLASIVGGQSTDNTLVIISALGSATRDLEKCAVLSSEGKKEMAESILEELLRTTLAAAQDLCKDDASLDSYSSFLDECRNTLMRTLRGVSITRQLTPRVLDHILSYGELFALRLLELYLREKGIDCQSMDAREILVTDSQFGSARPLRRETHHNVSTKLLPVFSLTRIVLMQGFVARDEHGMTTTMGRESSNLTAALMAEMLHAGDMTVYTDVEGIRTADPVIVSGSKIIPSLSYTQAYTLAVNGVKLLYPTMIEPLRRAQIPMEIRSLRKPMSDYTRISSASGAEQFTMVLMHEHVTQFRFLSRTLSSTEMIREKLRALSIHSTGVHLYCETHNAFSLVSDTSAEAIALDLHLPDDCAMSRSDGFSLITLINPSNNFYQRYHEVLARESLLPPITSFITGLYSAIVHVICPAEVNKKLLKLFHDSM